MLRRFDALGRFLLKGMHDPEIISKLYGVHDAKCIAAVGQCNLQNSRAKALERFGNIRFSALGRNGQSRQADRLRPGGNFSNSLRAALIQEMGRVCLVIGSSRQILNTSVVTNDNSRQDFYRRYGVSHSGLPLMMGVEAYG